MGWVCVDRAANNKTIIEGGQLLLPSTVNLGEESLNYVTYGVDDAWSRGSGHYYCNEIFYRSLHAVREDQITPHSSSSSSTSSSKTLLPVIFIHLPEVSSELPISRMVEAVETVARAALLNNLAHSLRGIEGSAVTKKAK